MFPPLCYAVLSRSVVSSWAPICLEICHLETGRWMNLGLICCPWIAKEQDFSSLMFLGIGFLTCWESGVEWIASRLHRGYNLCFHFLPVWTAEFHDFLCLSQLPWPSLEPFLSPGTRHLSHVLFIYSDSPSLSSHPHPSQRCESKEGKNIHRHVHVNICIYKSMCFREAHGHPELGALGLTRWFFLAGSDPSTSCPVSGAHHTSGSWPGWLLCQPQPWFLGWMAKWGALYSNFWVKLEDSLAQDLPCHWSSPVHATSPLTPVTRTTRWQLGPPVESCPEFKYSGRV